MDREKLPYPISPSEVGRKGIGLRVKSVRGPFFRAPGVLAIEQQRRARSFPYPSPEGPWDFQAAKRETALQHDCHELPDTGKLRGAIRPLQKGQYHMHRLIRTFADIKDNREKGSLASLCMCSLRIPLSGGIQNLKKVP